MRADMANTHLSKEELLTEIDYDNDNDNVQEMKQMRADMANTNLAKEKLRREMEDQQKVLDEKNALLETVTKVRKSILIVLFSGLDI